MKEITVLLYPDFTALDAFGPLEALGRLPDHEVHYVSLSGGMISSHGLHVMTDPISSVSYCEIFLIPGGFGSRKEIRNEALLSEIRRLSSAATFVLTVCTGSALLGKAGVLSGKRATGNKKAMDWTMAENPDVHWVREARWVQDGKYYTSGGVSAGTDMALGFISDRYGREKAEEIAELMEYVWNDEKEDGFCFLRDKK